jgi:hypothetical protein
MIRASKHSSVSQVKMILNGGLNYSSTPSNIADNELRRARNMIYDPSTDYLVTRPGTVCQTAAVCDSTNPIIAIYYYEQSTSVAYLVAACNGKLYYLSGASLNAWTEIGSLTDNTTTPSFLTFNTKLLIADGGDHIRTWDGSTYTTLGTSPKATALKVIKNRVVCNATDEPDSVYLSKPNDETDWNTSGTAVGLKAGYGDNLAVNGFAVFGDDLIISKKGNALKKFYRLNVEDATTTNWYIQELSSNNAVQNPQSIMEAWNNVFFVDTNGFKSLKGVQQYGDLQIDAIGRKINQLFATSTTCDFLYYIPKYNALWFGMGDRVFCYTERYGYDTTSESTVTIPAFTDLVFQQGRIRSICQADETVYLAGHDGFLYKLDESKATDATDASTTENFSSIVRTKTINTGSDLILRKLQWYLRPKVAGAASANVAITEENVIKVKNITLPSDGDMLADATGYLADATGYLADSGASAWTETTRNRVRNTEMAFELNIASGRVGVEWVRADIAALEGGE